MLILTVLFYGYKGTRAYQFIQTEKQIGIVPTSTYCVSRYLEYGPLQTLSPFMEAFGYLNSIKKQTKITYPTYKLKNQIIENIIVVLGESAQRNALQLYNSTIPTTPYAKQREQQLYIYTQAIAPSAYTNTAIALMLSNQVPTENFATLNFSNNIIHLAHNTQQWHTYWLSNQEQLSRFSTFYTQQAEQAHSKQYTSNTYDEALLPLLQKVVKDNHKKRMIFMHLQGSHFNAKDRYPTSFDNFKQYPTYQNEYYNSIRYTDYLIEQVIQTVEHTPSVVIYIADHGQDIINKQFVHAFTSKGLQVPFYIWSSSTLDKSLYKTGINTTPISTTQLYNILTEYMGIEGLPLKDPNKELRVLNPQLKVQTYETLKE
ncbi:MAG: phosphoethanolamine transferase [Flavobacteriaceae bacterium]|nr:phosphoethanolamine transferase [Flavobacteriaceae bacterium]